MTGSTRKDADDLAAALRDLHRALIHAEAGDDPAFANPYTLLFAVIDNPRFAWLEELSRLIVEFDEARGDPETFSEVVVADTAAKARALIGEDGEASPEFRLRHLVAVQSAPDVALATGRLRAVLNRLGG